MSVSSNRSQGDKIALFKSLFRGRSDIFAKRWEKDGRSGYSPAYRFDWGEFNAHRAAGGTIKDFDNKTPILLTDQVLKDHFSGRLTVGIYPILEDNTSYFLAADFDGSNWFDEAVRYQDRMKKIGLSAYIERSRSGNGAHVWVFFDEPYPCYKSRAIGLEVARQVLGLSDFDKEACFDRLFPSQDVVTANGLGNLIALPFQGESVCNGNTVFIDAGTKDPYDDQYDFLINIRKHSSLELDKAYELAMDTEPTIGEARSSKLSITLSQNISIPKSELTPVLVKFLRDQLNFINTEYLTKKRLGKSLYQVQKYFRLIDESSDYIFLPRGFLAKLLSFLRENNIEYVVKDTSSALKNCDFKSKIVLSKEQERIVKITSNEKQGVIVAPPGSGKTIMGLEIIARHQKSTLILVHRKQLLDQWVERAEQYLGIPKTKIGQFSSTKKKAGEKITVGLLQSLARKKDIGDLRDRFGTIIVDECHHIPAKTFRAVISGLNPKYLYGLTATPKRKFNDEHLIFVYIGEIIAEMELPTGKKQSKTKNFDIIVHKTGLSVPYDWRTDHFDLIAKTICYDTERNAMVASSILDQVGKKRTVLVLSERKEHLKILELHLRGKCETITFSGDDSVASRKIRLKQINEGHFQVILATGQLIGEGVSLPCIETLVIAFPIAFEGKLVQYIGRLKHSANPKALIDFHDENIPFLDRQFKNRKRIYDKQN